MLTELFTALQDWPPEMYSAGAAAITGLALAIWAIVGLNRAEVKKHERARVGTLRSAIRPLATTASEAGRTSNENEAA